MSVLAISTLMTETYKKPNPQALDEFKFGKFLCIDYLAQLDGFSIEALINLSSKINPMQPSFTRILDLYICKTNIDI